MRQRLLRLFGVYFVTVIIFILQRPVFILWNHNLFSNTGLVDMFSVIWHGLPLDFSLAGYICVIPSLIILLSVWFSGKWMSMILHIYFAVISGIIAVISVVDLILYEYWGFRLDTTPFFYFLSGPKDALASVSGWMIFAGIIVMLIYGWLLYEAYSSVFIKPLSTPLSKGWTTAFLLLTTVLLFIPIRGGFTVSTMNTGKVYFSQNQRLNHAAINPLFSLIESCSRAGDFKSQYRFMEASQADAIFKEMLDVRISGRTTTSNKAAINDSTDIYLFNTSRPDIILVIMESFSNHLMGELGGLKDVAVNLDSISRTGILFTNFYANSFRTDRGLVSILSGYPAQPTASIMKHTAKTASLPSISSALKKKGYDSRYYYGGDADFTNMRSYLVSSGFEKIISDVDFPISERASKWGAPDHALFNRFIEDYKNENSRMPRYRVIQTSSSHEPFEVPFKKLDNMRLNAFAYTDSCIGAFIRELSEMPQWKNTVVIFVADHLGCYPENIDNLRENRYRIPLIISGGAVKAPMHIDTYGSQQDIAATLLAQLGIEHDEFKFSKDIMNRRNPHFAFFTVPDAVGYADDKNAVIFDNQSSRVAFKRGLDYEGTLDKAKAYLQKLYDDIDAR